MEQIIAQKRDLSGVILDLRDNPGGLVPEAIHVASEFISEGAILLEQGKSDKRTYAATGKGRLIGMPLVVLVNQGSASSAEIVAGALRDRLGVKIDHWNVSLGLAAEVDVYLFVEGHRIQVDEPLLDRPLRGHVADMSLVDLDDRHPAEALVQEDDPGRADFLAEVDVVGGVEFGSLFCSPRTPGCPVCPVQIGRAHV